MKIIIILLLFIPVFANCQDCKKTYTDSVILTKENIYNGIRSWLSKNFDNSNYTIKMENKEQGKIICKGNFYIKGKQPLVFKSLRNDDYVSFTLTIDVKDNKYRLVWEDLFHHSGSSGVPNGGSLCRDKPATSSINISKKRWDKIKDETDITLAFVESSIKNDIQKNKSDNF